MLVLRSIHIYPIKATAAIDLDEAVVEPRGLAYDRRWMLVDEHGRFLTQRDQPRLSLIRTKTRMDSIDVSAPGIPSITIPMPDQFTLRERVQIWQDTVSAVVAENAAHRWFSQFLGLSCRLVYMDEAAIRPVDPDYAVSADEVSFADGYPLLLTSEASLATLNERLVHPVPMERFRSNLVVSGQEGFAEDAWREIQVGEVRFHIVKPCARCVVTTVDQKTGVSSKEPLKTLSTFRKRGGKVYFGLNLIPDHPGVVRVGDAVHVLAR